MEETLIVIMLKERETGFFYKELCSISIGNMEKYLQNINGQYTEDNKIVLNMLVTTNRDVLDWEYDGILDIYEVENIKVLSEIISVEEVQDCFNPTWSIKFLYDEALNDDELESFVLKILKLHKKELDDTYETLEEVKDDYINNEE
ncbi:MAG: DUF6762 family protein [Lachnospirales bacterium]